MATQQHSPSPHSVNGNHNNVGMEKDLYEDAAWKRIQQNTFTRWANERLKCVDLRIQNLETGLSDGLLLIALTEVLSKKKIPRYNKKPTLRTHKLENVSLALRFLEEVEQVHLVNIDSSDIVDQRIKLILGLMWTLILKYSLSMPVWDDEHQPKPTVVNDKPKQRLMNWIQSKIPQVKVGNFTSDWQDGKHLGALVDSCAPGLCPNWTEWQKQNALQNTTEAMDLADNWLGVAKLIEPQEFISPDVDEMSMMTYLSQYPNARVKPDAPIRPKTDASKIRVFGPGVESVNVLARHTTYFNVDCSETGDGNVELSLKDEEGRSVPLEIVENTSGVLASYSPPKPGQYILTIIFAGHEINQSPISIRVQPHVDTSVIHVKGLDAAAYANSPNEFYVDCRSVPSHNKDKLKCLMHSPSGKTQTLHVIEDKLDGIYKINYTPAEEGLHHFDISYDDLVVSSPTVPYITMVQPNLDYTQCTATGPGLKRGFVNVPANFVVETKGAGSGRLNISIEGPSNTKINSERQKDGSYLVSYVPTVPGDYSVAVRWDNHDITGSPFNVSVEYPVDHTKVRAWGSGLESKNCRPGEPLTFRVDASKSGSAPLNVNVVPNYGSIERLPQITQHLDNQYDVVYYAPKESSVCTIHITYGGKEIPDSPFRLDVLPSWQPDKVRIVGEEVISLGEVPASVPYKFTVDTTSAGYANLEVIVMGPDNLPYPVNVIDRENGLYDVSFLPDGVGPYNVRVKYGGQEIPQSPYNFNAAPTGDASKCFIVDGIQESVVINKEYRITVNTADAGHGFVTCRIIPHGGSPKTAAVDVEIGNNQDGTFSIFYTPRHPDSFKIIIKFGGQVIPRGEWTVTAFTPDDFQIYQLRYRANDGLSDFTYLDVHQQQKPLFQQQSPSLFEQQQKLPPFFEHQQQQPVFEHHPLPYEQPKQEFFNQATPLSRDQSDQREPTENVGHLLEKQQPVSSSAVLPVEFWNIALPGPNHLLEAEVIMPGGKVDLPSIKENHDGSVTIKYQPKERGLHEMHILYDKVHVQGSPFQFHVDGIRNGYVTAYGSGLSYGTAGEPCTFTVCLKDAGGGGLSVVIDGPAKAELKCHDNKDGTVSASWIPPVPGEYKVGIKFAEKEIKGSPFTVKVAGEGRKRAHISVGSTSEVSLKVSEPDLKGMSASIKSPSGIEEPCFIRLLDDGHIGISFTPREVGEHLVNVKKKNVLLPNAPFRIHVGENEVGNANKVKMSGPGLEHAKTQQFNEIVVNTREAGFGGLSVSIEGPSKCEIVCKENKDGLCKIHYNPTEPGVYVISVKFADHHVPGSPFTVMCQGQGVGTVSEKVQQKRNSASVVFADEECQLCLKIPGTNPMDMSAKLTSPSHKVEDVEIIDLSDSQYVIKFTPKEVGLHNVSVFYQGTHISGSPFQFTVGPFKEGGAHKVRVGGSGLLRGEVLEPQSFNIYTREAGAGNLSIAIEGPSKAKIDCQDHKDGNCYVTYNVTKPGDYAVAVKFDDQHVPDSPFKVYISPSTGESRKLQVAHLPDMGLPVNKPVTFTILTHGADGHLDAKVVSPSGTEDDCFIAPIDEGESYAVRFIPKEAGNYYVHIRLDGTHMKDSPFRIRVGGKDETDPTAVTASGDGLKGGETGQKLEFIINTCNAGSGILTVSVDGPSKVTLDAYEVDVGYKVRYTPLAPGDYYMTIKFNSIHIPGSPFKVKITGKRLGGSGYNESSFVKINAVSKTGKGVSQSDAPKLKGDASLVQCKGMGLKRGHTGRQNAFSIDCSTAGQDLLFVAVLTPKGPSEEVIVKHAGRGQYNVNYLTRDRGVHYVYVKYGHKDVPGSPFPVEF